MPQMPPGYNPLMRCLLATSILLVSACAATAPVAPDGGALPVTFAIDLKTDWLTDQKPATFTVYTAQMIYAEDYNDRCGNLDGDATDPCPAAFSPKPVVPEVFTFSKAALLKGASFTSQNVRMGDRYRVTVEAYDRPECAGWYGNQEGAAGTARVSLHDITLSSTESCLISNAAGGLISNNAGGLISNAATPAASPSP